MPTSIGKEHRWWFGDFLITIASALVCDAKRLAAGTTNLSGLQTIVARKSGTWNSKAPTWRGRGFAETASSDYSLTALGQAAQASLLPASPQDFGGLSW